MKNMDTQTQSAADETRSSNGIVGHLFTDLSNFANPNDSTSCKDASALCKQVDCCRRYADNPTRSSW